MQLFNPVSFPEIVVDTNNSTTTPLSASATFTGTATDITNYAQINLELFGRPSSIQGDGSTAKASLFFEFSPDGTNFDISVPILVRDPGLFIPYPLINVGRFFRIRYLNDGGVSAATILGLPTSETGTPTAQTVFRLNTQLLSNATKELARTLDQSVSGSDPVSLGRSVVMGKTTDNTYLNFRADGVSDGNSSTATLLANATFTGDWFDTQGYAGFASVVKSNVVSATNGWQIQFSPDNGVTIIDTLQFNYTSIDLNDGIRHSGPLVARFVRVVYQNGGTNQGNFFLQTSLSVTPAQVPISTIEQTPTTADSVAMVRGITFAQDPSNSTYQNITRSTLDGSNRTGLHVAIAKHEIATPIKALTSMQMTQATISTSAVQVASTALTNRKSVSLKALSSNGSNRSIFIGHSNAVTTSTGYELASGDSIDLEIDDTVSIFAIANTGSNILCIAEVAGSSSS